MQPKFSHVQLWWHQSNGKKHLLNIIMKYLPCLKNNQFFWGRAGDGQFFTMVLMYVLIHPCHIPTCINEYFGSIDLSIMCNLYKIVVHLPPIYLKLWSKYNWTSSKIQKENIQIYHSTNNLSYGVLFLVIICDQTKTSNNYSSIFHQITFASLHLNFEIPSQHFNTECKHLAIRSIFHY
jgi:hypothetical protein